MAKVKTDKTKYSVYLHITPNDKKYVGITCQYPEARWGSNGTGYKHQKLFYRAIQKYGWDNIEHHILIDNISYEEAVILEKSLIGKYQSNNAKYGYNCTAGGEGIPGYKMTYEQRETRRHNSTGRKHTLESRKLMSEKQKGRIVTEETRKKLSLANKGKPAHNKGVSMSDEQRHKISLTKMGHPGTHTQAHTEETKRKISEKQKGKIVSQETREKLRQKAREQWNRQKQNKNKGE